MQSVSSLSDPLADSTIPAWKRELILRKRAANARAAANHNSQLVPAKQSCSIEGATTQSLLQGQAKLQLLEETERSVEGLYYQRSVQGPDILQQMTADPHFSSCSGSDGGGVVLAGSRPTYHDCVEKCMRSVVCSSASGVNVGDMHHRGLYGDEEGIISKKVAVTNDNMSNGDEDLQYGPGIVSKLKNRYLSLAMREAKSRPALRRFSSLEDLLESEDAPAAPRGRSAAPSASKREAMKRARSVDCLTAARNRVTGATGPPTPTSKEQKVDSLSSYTRRDVIIIESSNDSSSDMPPKLKNIKSVFEQKNQSRVITSAGGPWKTAAGPKVKATGVAPLNKSSPAGNNKPLLKAKPAGLLARRSDSIEDGKVTPKQVDVVRPSPRSTPPPPPPTTRHMNGDTPLRSGTTPLAPKSLQMSSPSLKSPDTQRPLPPTPTQISFGAQRSTKSIESTRVLLENRKNVQKSRRAPTIEDAALKPSDLAAPKPVVLVESQENGTPVRPPSLPLRSSVVSSTVPSPAPRLTSPISPPILSSPLSPPVVTSPSAGPMGKNLGTPSFTPVSSMIPSHTSTPTTQGSPSQDRTPYSTILSQASSTVPPKPPPSPIKERAPPVPIHTPIKSPSPVKSSVKKEPVVESKSRPTTRPPSPPIQRNHFVSIKASAPKVANSPTATSPPSPVKRTTLSDFKNSSSSLIREKEDPNLMVAPSPIKTTTKVTTFSSSGDEITEVVEAVNSSAAATVAGNIRGGNKGSKDRWHQDQSNSLVFNFVGTKAHTPDYIENDGVDISKRVNKQLLDSGYVRLPGYDDCDSSTDDWDEDGGSNVGGVGALRAGETPPPCPFTFIGDAVIIKGRSNLQRQPKSKKMNISFNDSATKTFEYPSEASLIEDPDNEDGLNSNTSATLQGLASYTPSKLALGDTFELGVSRTVGVLPPTSSRPPPEGEEVLPSSKVEDEYLRPAADEETVAWSAGGTSDMLF